MSNYTQKNMQINMPPGNIAFGLYLNVTALVSGILYFAMTKFNLCLNGVIVLASFISAIMCMACLPVTFASLKYNGIFLGSIFSAAGSNVIPMIMSYILFKEKTSYATIVSALCILIASALPMINKNEKKKRSPAGLFYALMMFLISGTSGTIVKITSELCGSESVLTLNFITNVFMFFMSFIWILFMVIKSKSPGRIKEFRPYHYFMTLIVSFSGTLSGYFVICMYDVVGVVPSIIISASISTLVTLTSSLVYKEKFYKRYILCIILSFFSLILPAVFT